MNKQDQKFVEYLEKLKCEGNSTVMESIITGFKAIVEYQVNGAPEIKVSDIMTEDEHPEEVVVVISDESPENCPLCQSDDPGIVIPLEDEPTEGEVQQPLFDDENPDEVWIDARFSVSQLRDLGFSDGEIEAMSASNIDHSLDEGVADIAVKIASNPIVKEAIKEGGKTAALVIIDKLKQLILGEPHPIDESMTGSQVKANIYGKNSDKARNAEYLEKQASERTSTPTWKSTRGNLKAAIEMWNRQQESYGKPENVIGRKGEKLEDGRKKDVSINESSLSELISIANSLMEVGENIVKATNVNLRDPKFGEKLKAARDEFERVAYAFKKAVNVPGTADLFVNAYNQRAPLWYKEALAKQGLTMNDVPEGMTPMLSIQESIAPDQFQALLDQFDSVYNTLK